MNVEFFTKAIGADFYTGVPDSQLKALCNFLLIKYGIDPKHHVIAANEGNCVGIAAGYHLATGKVPVVYLQNSGQGNIINPVASLLDKKVYGIPVVFVIGWRGEPGIKDEPQHIFQGEITLKLLEDLEIDYFIIDKDTIDSDITEAMSVYQEKLKNGDSVAFVVKKGALAFDEDVAFKNNYEMVREEVLEKIVEIAGDDPIVCTTGKSSRELYEIRERNGQGHEKDFLTVGSMGHASSIALGIALNKPDRNVWCIDGDGAALMHMGAMAVIGATAPKNLKHIVINNEAHESVGGQPTVANKVNFTDIAKACGYSNVFCVDAKEDIEQTLIQIKSCYETGFIEIKCAIGSRKDLGRPIASPTDNKKLFMNDCNIK